MIGSWARDVRVPRARRHFPPITGAVAFPASDAAGYITGDSLVVSGGLGVHARS